jgi:hypothetical protein
MIRGHSIWANQQACLIQKSRPMLWLHRFWEIIRRHPGSSNNSRLIAGTGQCVVIDSPRDGCLKECIEACGGRTLVLGNCWFCASWGLIVPPLSLCRSGTVLMKHSFVNVKVNMHIADRSVAAASKDGLTWMWICKHELYSCSSTTLILFSVNSNSNIPWQRIIPWSVYFFSEWSIIIQLKSNSILWKQNFDHCHHKSPTPNSVFGFVQLISL